MRPLSLLLLLCATPALALDGHYAVQGQDAAGAYRGLASVAPTEGDALRVRLTLRGPEGRREAGALLSPCPGGFELVGPGRVGLARADETGWAVQWWDEAGQPLARERWRPAVEIEVAVAAVGAHEALPGLDAEEARAGQAQVLARLNEVYGELGIHFRPWRSPRLVPGARCDRDGDGRLSRAEVEALRDELERRGIKRPGRVVVALTRAPFVGHGARGWTLGDALQTPATLEDLNDNFSLIGLDHVGPGSHTVAHEVGHQFGLDDLGPQNAPILREPWRDDHLMHSGGEGFHLDPAVVERLERWVACEDNGLGGRRGVRVLEPQAASAPRDPGLGTPPPAFRR